MVRKLPATVLTVVIEGDPMDERHANAIRTIVKTAKLAAGDSSWSVAYFHRGDCTCRVAPDLCERHAPKNPAPQQGSHHG